MQQDLWQPANDSNWSAPLSRTSPIAGTLRRVPGYPDKLRIYMIGASPYWQVRCFFGNRMHCRSLRTSDVRRAMRGAQAFYEELTALHAGGADPRAALAGTSRSAGPLFRTAASRLIDSERARVERGTFSAASLSLLEGQLRTQLLPRFGDLPLAELQFAQIDAFMRELSAQSLASMTIHHYMIALRKVLKCAVAHGLLKTMPAVPSVSIASSPRGGLSASEYRLLHRRARALSRIQELVSPRRRSSAGGVFARNKGVHAQWPLLIRFMVNSFVRPHDIRLMQHKHVEIVRGKSTYLRLTLPQTKRKTSPVVTMQSAVRVYQRLLEQSARSNLAGPEDYVFMPEVTDRRRAMWLLDTQFARLLVECGLRENNLGKHRTLYSLRHTAIMFRLLYGKGIDLLTLARNARTSVAMIERFYASNLTAEMNIDLLQSRRPRAA